MNDRAWPHGSEERRQAYLMVEAFQQRRRRNWYRPKVWMAGKTGLSLVATTATVAILFLLVLAVAGFLGTTVMTVGGVSFGLLLIHRISRGLHCELSLPGKIQNLNDLYFNQAYEEFVAEELFEDEDWVQRLSRPRLPVPTAWLHLWGPILDLTWGLLKLFGYGSKGGDSRST
jgi:hypothetical protein